MCSDCRGWGTFGIPFVSSTNRAAACRSMMQKFVYALAPKKIPIRTLGLAHDVISAERFAGPVGSGNHRYHGRGGRGRGGDRMPSTQDPVKRRKPSLDPHRDCSVCALARALPLPRHGVPSCLPRLLSWSPCTASTSNPRFGTGSKFAYASTSIQCRSCPRSLSCSRSLQPPCWSCACRNGAPGDDSVRPGLPGSVRGSLLR